MMAGEDALLDRWRRSPPVTPPISGSGVKHYLFAGG